MSDPDDYMGWMEESCTCGDYLSHPDGGDSQCRYCAGAIRMQQEWLRLSAEGEVRKAHAACLLEEVATLHAENKLLMDFIESLSRRGSLISQEFLASVSTQLNGESTQNVGCEHPPPHTTAGGETTCDACGATVGDRQ